MISAEFTAWDNRRRFNAWPRAGGWQDQPLSLLVHMAAFDLVVGTKDFMDSHASADAGEGWDQMSITQVDLIGWLEG